MKKEVDRYFVIPGWDLAEQEAFLGRSGHEFPGQILVGPDGFEASYSHDVLEDITFERDLKPIVERLNKLHDELKAATNQGISNVCLSCKGKKWKRNKPEKRQTKSQKT